MQISFPGVLLALIALASACAPRAEAPGASPAIRGVADGWNPGPSRVVVAPTALVVSGSPVASEVGRDILRQGGNAVDAAVAVGFALAVVHPEAGNIGGGGFMVIRMDTGGVQTLDYRETAPGRASRDMYVSAGPEASVTGHLSAGVPGAVAGLTEAHRKYGRLPFATVIAPAIRLAYDGFVVDDYRSRSIGEDSARLVSFPASRATFLPNDRPPVAGSTFRQPELGSTLEAVRDSGAAGFYRGWVADLIVAEMARGGGLISYDDLGVIGPSGAIRSRFPIGVTRCTPCRRLHPVA